MTKAERNKIEEGLRLIMSENGFDQGVIILADLCGIRTAYHSICNLKTIDVLSIIQEDDPNLRIVGGE